MMKVIFCFLLLVKVSAYAAGEANMGALAETPVVAEATMMGEGSMPSTEAVKAAPAAEDQIPLNISTGKKSVEAGGSSTRILFTGLVIVVLLGTAYYFVRKYKFSNNINKSNMQIKVLSQHYLGPKKSLAIIRVSGESILIGVTDTNISMIKSLSLIDDEVPSETPQNFGDALNKQSANGSGSGGQTAMVDELDEEFSFAGVKDSVSKKIKSMRSFS